jgi:ATP-dependent DNA helicase RecG
MLDLHTIPTEEARRLLELEEGHYLDVKGKAIKPAKLSKSIAAFANTSGGEIFVGIEETLAGEAKSRSWDGFKDMEAANAHIQTIEAMASLGNHYSAVFLQCENLPGIVLHLTVLKTKDILHASDGIAYVRRNAQNLRVTTEDALRRLRLDKGVATFEDETVSVAVETISNSLVALEFVLGVIPSAEPEAWLRSQFLINDGKPTVAGILLFSDEPQAALPKRSAIKLYRYKSKEEQGTRDTLAFSPTTIEGCIYRQITEAVHQTKKLIEGIKRLGVKGLEAVSYPDETLHEIITNAVLHRDYSIPTDIHIRVYDNRIEVESPGKLPGHITPDNILDEQAARNPKVVRLINKFPDPPNKDVGEGLNTAFAAMKRLRLREPEVTETETAVIVYIGHSPLASPEQTVMDYLKGHEEITNSIGRDLTGIRSENSMKDVFLRLKKRNLIEPVPEKRGSASAWRKATGERPTGTEAVDEDEPTNGS